MCSDVNQFSYQIKIFQTFIIYSSLFPPGFNLYDDYLSLTSGINVSLSLFVFSSHFHNAIMCVFYLVETSVDPSLKATDSSAAAMQDGSDKHYKKVHSQNSCHVSSSSSLLGHLQSTGDLLLKIQYLELGLVPLVLWPMLLNIAFSNVKTYECDYALNKCESQRV